MEREVREETTLLVRRAPDWQLPGAAVHQKRAMTGFLAALAATALGLPALVMWLLPSTMPYMADVAGIVLALLTAGGLIGAKKLAAHWDQRALAAIVTDAEHLPQLKGLPDGELVRVHGSVARRSDVPCPDGIVYARRRKEGTKVIAERAVDFALVDETHGEVWIDVAEARLLHASGDQDRLSDCVVRIGDLVEVVGWKARTSDQTLHRLERETPERILLRSGRALPLLIIPGIARRRRLLAE